MKASELRIWNIINVSEDKSLIYPAQVVEIKTDYILWDNSEFEPISQCWMLTDSEYDNIQPIPLTEEWLLKMGLNEDGINILLMGDYEIWFERVGNELYLKTECSSKKIEFVHTAQNIKFALTGSELVFTASQSKQQ